MGFGGNYIIIDQEHDLMLVTRWIDEAKVGEVFSLISKSAGVK